MKGCAARHRNGIIEIEALRADHIVCDSCGMPATALGSNGRLTRGNAKGYRLSETIGAFFEAVPEAGFVSIATGAVTMAVPSKRISATNAPGVE